MHYLNKPEIFERRLFASKNRYIYTSTLIKVSNLKVDLHRVKYLAFVWSLIVYL